MQNKKQKWLNATKSQAENFAHWAALKLTNRYRLKLLSAGKRLSRQALNRYYDLCKAKELEKIAANKWKLPIAEARGENLQAKFRLAEKRGAV